MKLTNHLDFNQLESRNEVLHNLAAAPASPKVGQIYYNTASNAAFMWDGTIWISLDARKLVGVIPLAALAVSPVARANHTGTQTAATISDLAATVQAYNLGQFAAPVAAVSWGSQRLINLADPTAAQDAATKGYVDNGLQSAAAGIDSKPSVRAVAAANITLSGLQTLDGVSLAAGDRVLCAGQTTGSQNGVYVVASGAWTRALDADQTGEINPGAFWFVEEGSSYGKTQWRCNNTGAITLGTTAISIIQFGAASMYAAGNGLALAGSVFSVNPVASGGILSAAGGVQVDTSVVVRKFSATVGDGSTTSITVTHNLAIQDVQVGCRDVTTQNALLVDWSATSANTLTLSFAVAPALNSIRVTVQG